MWISCLVLVAVFSSADGGYGAAETWLLLFRAINRFGQSLGFCLELELFSSATAEPDRAPWRRFSFRLFSLASGVPEPSR